jgi:hypothetical protein
LNKGGSNRGKRKNTKWVIISIALVAVLGAGAVSAVSFSSNNSAVMRDLEADFGGLGSAHEHAAFLVIINGKKIDFASSKYQVKSQYIHVENRIGTTIHRHAISAHVGEFFESVGMEVKDNCFISDDGNRYCDSESNQLRFFVDGVEYEANSIMKYIPQDDDRFLLVYGHEDEEGVSGYLQELNGLRIFRS